jgi:hypothetical protein
MADRGPNYDIERRRLQIAIDEHLDTIEKGIYRLAEIERAKKRNTDRAELANVELDAESERSRENEAALRKAIKEIEVNLKLMAAPAAKGASDG